MLLSYNIFSRYYYFYSPHVAGNIIGAEQNSPYGDVFWSHRDQGSTLERLISWAG